MGTKTSEHHEEAPRGGRVCLVVPSYNHAEPLRAVLRRALRILPDVIVVNNGSTDATEEVLARFPAVRRLRFRRNAGKGKALAAGMELARRQGFTHAITMDANGHLSPEDLPQFLEGIRRNPTAVLLGVRTLPSRTLPSRTRGARGARWLRRISNVWVWLQTGHWFADTCSGYRAYPLNQVARLSLNRVHYEFEIETLVKSVWLGLPVEEIPVRATLLRRRRSHFRLLADGWRVLRLLVALLWQRVALPAKVRAMMHLKVFGRLPRKRRLVTYLKGFMLQETESPREIGLSLGIGVCLGILPIWGFQMVAAYLIAQSARLSKPLMVTATGLSLGPLLPLILYVSLLIGRIVVDGELDFDLDLFSMDMDTFWEYLIQYVAGACILGAACGAAAGFAGYRFARAYLGPDNAELHEQH